MGRLKPVSFLKWRHNLKMKKKKEVLDSFLSDSIGRTAGCSFREQGTEIKEIERKFIDTRVFEVERITGRVSHRFITCCSHMLGETEGVNYASMEQMALEFVQGTLVPIVTQYEKEFNRKLLTPGERLKGRYFKFNINSLLRGDMKTRGEFYFKGVRTGFFKPNEVRGWEDLPPEPGGDKLYMSGDLYPVDQPRERK